MTDPTLGKARRTWFIQLSMLGAAPIVLAAVARFVSPHLVPDPSFARLHTLCMVMAAAEFLLGTVALFNARRPARGQPAKPPGAMPALATPARFLVASIVGMALFEAVSMNGFVLVFQGGDPAECMAWSGVSLVGLLGVALPIGLGYWRDMEKAPRGPEGSPPPLG